jgi:predicted house-cleaning noncanonical NTP pyrophosphatase (MazG superfamily)
MKPKLVRNRIPTIIAEDNKRIAFFYTADNAEYWQRLQEKLIEEVQEFMSSHEVIELADILEVIDALAQAKNSSFAEIMNLKQEKAQSHGTFTDRIILYSTKQV